MTMIYGKQPCCRPSASILAYLGAMGNWVIVLPNGVIVGGGADLLLADDNGIFLSFSGALRAPSLTSNFSAAYESGKYIVLTDISGSLGQLNQPPTYIKSFHRWSSRKWKVYHLIDTHGLSTKQIHITTVPLSMLRTVYACLHLKDKVINRTPGDFRR